MMFGNNLIWHSRIYLTLICKLQNEVYFTLSILKMIPVITPANTFAYIPQQQVEDDLYTYSNNSWISIPTQSVTQSSELSIVNNSLNTNITAKYYIYSINVSDLTSIDPALFYNCNNNITTSITSLYPYTGYMQILTTSNSVNYTGTIVDGYVTCIIDE